ncbi:MAG: helix-turn-helix domain-containing protein, partial [Caldilineaceae bacterium]|nr:helix-turn-helix domain-containing protein [Caldilineaceae bacterium]
KPSWEKLNALCVVLECKVDDIVVYDRPKAMALAAM